MIVPSWIYLEVSWIACPARFTIMSKSLWKPLRISWDFVSNSVVLFLTVSVMLSNMIQKSTPELPKSSPKPSRINPKTFQNPPKVAPKTRSGGDCASDRFWAFIFLGSVGVLGCLGRLLGPSWSRLGASGGVLEPSWHDLGAVLGRPWGVKGRLGASWGRPGVVLGHLGSVSE